MSDSNNESSSSPEKHEKRRMEALDSYNILDTASEQEFDDLTKLASNICGTPISLINLIGVERQWTKSSQGWDIKEISCKESFCRLTIEHDEWMIVEDATKDERFQNNKYVNNEPYIRFYAGINLKSPKGYNIGTLCVLDREPRQLTETQFENLKIIAREVVARFELRRKNKILRQRSSFLNNSTDLMMLIDPAGLTIQKVFQKTSETLGYDKNEMVSSPLADYLHEQSTDDLKDKLQSWRSGSKDKTLPLQLKKKLLLADDSEAWFQLSFTEEDDQIYLTGRNIEGRKKYNLQLKRLNEFSESIIDALPGIFYMLDDDNRVKMWNSRTKNITGYKENELYHKSINDLIHPDDLDSIKEKIREIRDKNVVTTEARLLTKEGESIPYYFSATHFNINDNTYTVGTGVDISDKNRYQKQLEDAINEREVLLSEIHHRVKNNLAIISGLLELEIYNTESPSVQDVLKGSQLRIRSMAIIHEKLYESTTFTSVPIESYINELTEAISNIYDPAENIEYRIQSEDIKLNVNQAIPLALIVNELLTNCYKHAFKGENNNNQIDMKLQKNGERVLFEIKDNGRGLPVDLDPDDTESLGFTLVQNLISQLEGNFKIIDKQQSQIQISFEAREIRGSSSTITPHPGKKHFPASTD